MKKLSIEEFIDRSDIIHCKKYNYSKSIYKGSKQKLIITCNLHGDFEQAASAHLTGQGCPLCMAEDVGNRFRKNTEWFISESKKIHGEGTYDYSKARYINAHQKVIIGCYKHGSFYQRPLSHIHNRHGCPECISGISKISAKWLDSLNISKECREQYITIDNKRIKPDAYVPETNTIYEFWGDYWHGNPKVYSPEDINQNNKRKFGDLYKATLDKRNLILSNGFNLIEKWETE